MKNQKENILLAATKLFYEQGYKNTYMEEIADVCEITKPLITYYFKTKSNLARQVTDKYLADHKNNIALKLYTEYFKGGKTDLQVSTAVEIRLYDTLHLCDSNALRFMKEHADENYEDTFPKDSVRLYKIHDRRYHLDIDRDADEISMIARSAMSSSLSVKLAYASGEFNCTLEECLDYLTRVHFVLMHIDKKRIDEIVAESKYVLQQVNFEIKPYFQVV